MPTNPNHHLNKTPTDQRNSKSTEMITDVNIFTYDIQTEIIHIKFSQRFIELYNMPSQKLDLHIDDYIQLIHPDDQLGLKRQIDNTNKANSPIHYEYRIKYPNTTTYCWISVVGRIKNDWVITGVQIDITNLKQTYDKFNLNKEEYDTIIENTNDLIIKLDLSGTILFISQSYCNLFQLNKEETIGRNIKDVNLRVLNANQNWLTQSLTPPYKTEEIIQIQTNNHEKKWISWSNNAVFKKGQVDHIFSIGRDITAIKSLNEQLKYDANHDTLTGLLNHRGITESLRQLDEDIEVCVFSCQMNNYASILNFYGHEITNLLIQRVANQLVQLKQQNCIIGRSTDSKFIIIYKTKRLKISINVILNRLFNKLNKNYYFNSHNIHINSSVGYAIYPLDGATLNETLRAANLAMSVAMTDASRGCLHFQASMNLKLEENINLSNKLQKAIKNKSITPVYQSIIDINTNQIKYIETLARWYDGPGPVISPGTFLPIAEQSGLIQELDDYIIKESLANFQEIRKQHCYKQTILTLNVSPQKLLNGKFPRYINNLVKHHQLDPSQICIEVNENTFMDHISTCNLTINQLKKLGFIIALDDFGVKYSSLSILDEVDFDIIKVDRNFVTKLHNNTVLTILKMVYEVCQHENKQVIIEGVEREQEVDILKSLGFNLMQGFYYSIPKPIQLNTAQVVM